MHKSYISFIIIYSISFCSFAQWSTNTATNTPVCEKIKNQENLHAVTDGNGGMVITWDDNRDSSASNGDIYIQRLNKTGIAQWANNGIAVCANNFTQKSSAIADVGNGNSVIVWSDKRNGNYDIYAQKIDSNGIALWAANGIAVGNGATVQLNPKVVGDNSGGAYIVWEDSASATFDIYAQHVNNDGFIQWASNGAGVCTFIGNQINPKIESDGASGAIITWQDKRNGNDYDIYAQKLAASGASIWTANGLAVCTSANTQSNPRIEPNGQNGAIIVWQDKRNGSDYDIYAQNINSSGNVQWTVNGLVICNANGNQSATDMKFIGTSGIFISWKDIRNGTYQIYSQIVDMQGVVQFATNGIQLSNSLKAINPNAINDANTNAIVVWQDSTSNGWDIKAQKITNNLSLAWGNGGKTVSNAVKGQVNPCNVSDLNGGAIFAWEDFRNNNDYDVFANHLNQDGLNGLEDFTNNAIRNFQYFPNPVTAQNTNFHIVSTKNKYKDVFIYTCYGQLIFKGKTDLSGLIVFDTSTLLSGIYHFCIEGSRGSFIVEK